MSQGTSTEGDGTHLHDAGTGWRPSDWWSAGLRLLLLLALGVGGATLLVAADPSPRSDHDLVTDLAAGRISYLEYQRGTGVVRWADGWWRWYETTPTLPTMTGDNPAVDLSGGDPTLRWLMGRVEASGHAVTVHVSDDQGWTPWPFLVVWWPLQLLTGAAWAVTLIMMLGTRRHRYANRWAWFWLFTVGQLGAVLYLIFEPRPIWRPGAWHGADRVPATGGTGCLWSILLSIAASLVVVGIIALL